MSWLLFALVGPVIFAIGTHIDKYLVERYFKNINPAVLLIPTAIVFILPIIWYFHREVFAIPISSMLVIPLSGILFSLGLLFYLWALQEEEASVISTLYEMVPIISCVLGFLILGEVLTKVQLTGAGLIIGGSILLTLEFTQNKQLFRVRPLLLMLATSFSTATGLVIFKFFSITDNFWVTIFWASIGEIIFGLILMLQSTYREQYFSFFKPARRKILIFGTFNELMNLLASWSIRYAVVLAPLALVQAVGSTTPVFTFLIAIVLTFLFPHIAQEKLTRGHLLQKGLAIAAVVAGTIIANV